MSVTSNSQLPPQLGITGHAGAGHVHSHSGFIQDDSAGFAVVSSLLNRAYPTDTSVKGVSVFDEFVTVETGGGGIGKARARRGFTLHEIELLQRSVSMDATLSQSVALHCFGRIYGQGVLEAPVAFQTALCRAVIDTFAKTYPDDILVAEEGLVGNAGACMGALITIQGISVAAMAFVNATDGGIGPAEDLEGNIALFDKGELMAELGLTNIPTIVVESKAYIPQICDPLTHNSFIVRYNTDYDNPAVGSALVKATQDLGLDVIALHKSYPRNSGEMRKTVEAFSQQLNALAEQLNQVETAAEKTAIVSELALLISQDAGAITYMTDKLHDAVAGGGLVPGTAAVVSLAITQQTIKECIIPELHQKDVQNYADICLGAIEILSHNTNSALGYLERKKHFNKKEIENLLSLY